MHNDKILYIDSENLSGGGAYPKLVRDTIDTIFFKRAGNFRNCIFDRLTHGTKELETYDLFFKRCINLTTRKEKNAIMKDYRAFIV